MHDYQVQKSQLSLLVIAKSEQVLRLLGRQKPCLKLLWVHDGRQSRNLTRHWLSLTAKLLLLRPLKRLLKLHFGYNSCLIGKSWIGLACCSQSGVTLKVLLGVLRHRQGDLALEDFVDTDATTTFNFLLGSFFVLLAHVHDRSR